MKKETIVKIDSVEYSELCHALQKIIAYHGGKDNGSDFFDQPEHENFFNLINILITAAYDEGYSDLRDSQ